MLAQLLFHIFSFTQALAYGVDTYTATVPAYTATTVQWRDITFVIPDTAFTEDTTLTIQDLGTIEDAAAPKLKKGFRSTQDVYTYVFSTTPQSEIPMTLKLDESDTTNRRRRIFSSAIGDDGQWTRVRSRVYESAQLIRHDSTASSARVVVGTHSTKLEVPVKLKEFVDFGALPYSDAGIVIDEKSRKVLYAQNPDKQRSIASLTKLLTSVVCLSQNPDLSQLVTYSSAYNPGGAVMPVYGGDTITLENALYGALVPSANNMAITIANTCGLSYADFVAQMNAYALSRRATSTHVDEPTGLDPDNVSTARNLSRIARAVFRAYPDVYEAAADFSTYSFTTQNTSRTVSAATTNLFDGRGKYEVIAFKTGYLPPHAERTLIVKVRKVGTDQTVIVVLLGNPQYRTIFDEAYQLIDWTFNNWVFQNYAS